MFDRSKEFVVKIISGGVKSCLLRFPTDAEFCDRARRQRTIRHFLGRGKSKTTDLNTEAVDLQLFAALRVEQDGQSFDAAEASAFIGRLDLADVVSAEWEGETRRMEMKVPGARTTHVLRIPRQSEIREHERATTDAVYANRSAEIRVALEPSGRLYDQVLVETQGYVGPVPINHKVAAVTNLLAALSQLLEGEDDDDPEA